MKILWQSSTIMYLKSSENHETRIIAIDSSCWWDHHYSTPKLVQMHTFYSVFRAQKPSQCLCSHQSHTFVIVPWRRRFFNDCLSGGRLGHQGADPLADGFSIAQAFPERWLWTCSLLLSLSSEETKKYLWDLFPTLEKTATVGYPLYLQRYLHRHRERGGRFIQEEIRSLKLSTLFLKKISWGIEAGMRKDGNWERALRWVHDAYFIPAEAETQRRQGNCPRPPSMVGTSAGRKPGGAWSPQAHKKKTTGTWSSRFRRTVLWAGCVGLGGLGRLLPLSGPQLPPHPIAELCEPSEIFLIEAGIL